jgi:hypothetical protein
MRTNNSRRYSSSHHLPKLINRLTRTEHGAAATLAFRATRAADAAARAPDVASAQGGCEEEPGEGGGATEKKEAILPPPDSSPLCFRSRFCLLFFFGWDIRILPPPIVPCHSRIARPSDMRNSLSFPARERARSSFPRASSFATFLRDHPLPACACAHSTVDAQHHSPKVGQAVVSCFPPLPICRLSRSWYSRTSFSSCFLSPHRRLCAFLGRPLMTDLRNSTAVLSNDRTNLTSN